MHTDPRRSGRVRIAAHVHAGSSKNWLQRPEPGFSRYKALCPPSISVSTIRANDRRGVGHERWAKDCAILVTECWRRKCRLQEGKLAHRSLPAVVLCGSVSRSRERRLRQIANAIGSVV